MTPEEKAALGYHASKRGGKSSLPVTRRVAHKPTRNQIGNRAGGEMNALSIIGSHKWNGENAMQTNLRQSPPCVPVGNRQLPSHPNHCHD